MRVANLITETLVRSGVTRIFSLSGNQIMPIYDALYDTGIPIVHVRHESAAVFMADAWAQMTGETGVALVTAGGGFTNALGAMYSVVCAESPVLLLSGDSPLQQDGTGAFQELDQVSMATAVSKCSVRLTNAERVAEDLAQAIRLAHEGRPGPVHISVPFDLVNEDVPIAPSKFEQLVFATPATDAERQNTLAVVEQVTRCLSASTRPVIVTGPACNGYRARGKSALNQLSRLLPVIPMESPRGLRDPALGNIRSVFKAADLVVLLGKATDFTMSFANTEHFSETVKFIVIDPDTAICDKARATLGTRATLVEQGDTPAVLSELSRQVDFVEGAFAEWNTQVADALKTRVDVPVQFDAAAGEPEGVHPAVLCQQVQEFLGGVDDPIAICDGGEFGQWSQAGIHAPMRIINGTSGTIGAGPCYGIAAKLSQPDATVLVFVGDGTVGFHLAEFETAVRLAVPVIVVIGHDARWNAEVEIQRRDYGEDRMIGCELAPTRYDLAVAAMGGHGEYVERSTDLQAALKRAVASGKPACISVRLNGQPAPEAVV
ncbi:MAG: thiamine pyrophosphate-binding protein [Granulosicoccus sp.]|nr:thiamine pyrophosphate-binding protein [Granulosicoccus sp.]